MIRPINVMKMAAESTMLFCNTSQAKAQLWSDNYFNTALEKVKLHRKLYIKATGAKHFYLGGVLLFTWLADIYVLRFKSEFAGLKDLGAEMENCKRILFPSKFSAEISNKPVISMIVYYTNFYKGDVTYKEVLFPTNVSKNQGWILRAEEPSFRINTGLVVFLL